MGVSVRTSGTPTPATVLTAAEARTVNKVSVCAQCFPQSLFFHLFLLLSLLYFDEQAEALIFMNFLLQRNVCADIHQIEFAVIFSPIFSSLWHRLRAAIDKTLQQICGHVVAKPVKIHLFILFNLIKGFDFIPQEEYESSSHSWHRAAMRKCRIRFTFRSSATKEASLWPWKGTVWAWGCFRMETATGTWFLTSFAFFAWVCVGFLVIYLCLGWND